MNMLVPVFGFVYRATNKINKKVYIGVTTTSLEQRKQNHLYVAQSKVHHARHYPFYKAIRKYGSENFVWEVLFTCMTEHELICRETLEIIKHWSCIKFKESKGYNQILGAPGYFQDLKYFTREQRMFVVSWYRKGLSSLRIIEKFNLKYHESKIGSRKLIERIIIEETGMYQLCLERKDKTRIKITPEIAAFILDEYKRGISACGIPALIQQKFGVSIGTEYFIRPFIKKLLGNYTSIYKRENKIFDYTNKKIGDQCPKAHKFSREQRDFVVKQYYECKSERQILHLYNQKFGKNITTKLVVERILREEIGKFIIV